jgi:hypothetical protein
MSRGLTDHSVRLGYSTSEACRRGWRVDPVSLAVGAVQLLVPFFRSLGDKLLGRVADDLSEAAAARVDALYERIKGALSPDPYDTALLEGAKAQPDDQTRQRNLQGVLVKYATEDDAFAADLAQLIAEAEDAGAVKIQVQDSGAFAGRDFKQIGNTNIGRDQINNPSPTIQPPSD